MANRAYHLVLPRFEATVNNGSDAYLTDVVNVEEYGVFGVSVQSDQDVTVTLLHGRTGRTYLPSPPEDEDDTATALPNGVSQTVSGATIAEGSGSSVSFVLPAGSTHARLMIANASGSNATVIADPGLRATL